MTQVVSAHLAAEFISALIKLTGPFILHIHLKLILLKYLPSLWAEAPYVFSNIISIKNSVGIKLKWTSPLYYFMQSSNKRSEPSALVGFG